jgi:uncharacterized SAM-binding protein YcdF (DUF218 family)
VIYWIKQFVGALATPMMLAFLMVIVGVAARWLGRRRLAVWLWAGAAVMIYLGSIAPVANALLAPLERKYPPLRDDVALPAVHYIVVLGSSYAPRDGIPVTAALNGDGLVRITEGVRLFRKLPAARLVVSGGAPAGKPTSARGYARLARDFGVPDASIVVLDQALDTSSEARSIATLLGREPFILVTSAYHMPRAMWLMTRAGTRPVPAPTGQLYGVGSVSVGAFRPTTAGLHRTETALHEYVGLAALASHLD